MVTGCPNRLMLSSLDSSLMSSAKLPSACLPAHIIAPVQRSCKPPALYTADAIVHPTDSIPACLLTCKAERRSLFTAIGISPVTVTKVAMQLTRGP